VCTEFPLAKLQPAVATVASAVGQLSEQGEVLLGDAFFPSYFLLWTLQMMGVDCLCEQMGGRGRSTDYRRGVSLGTRDHLITYEKPKCSQLQLA